MNDAIPLLQKLHDQLNVQHLSAVPVGQLMADAGATV